MTTTDPRQAALPMGEDNARREVRRAVDAAGGRSAFARKAGIDVGTIADFLDQRRWPTARSRNRIEQAAGWPVGRIADIAEGIDLTPRPAAPADIVDVSQLSPTQRLAIQAVVLAMQERHHATATTQPASAGAPNDPERARLDATIDALAHQDAAEQREAQSSRDRTNSRK